MADELARAIRLREAGNAEQACEILLALAERHPHDAVIAYQTGWAHDVLGREADAAPHYERALAHQGLDPEDRHGAYVGLGSTYRVLGRHDLARATLRRGLAEYPDDPVLRVFLAMALYNAGEAHDAVGTLLRVIAETATDPGLRRYRRAVSAYALDLDATV